MHIMHAHTEERGFLSGPLGTGLSLLMMLEPESWIYCGGEGRGRTAHYNQTHTHTHTSGYSTYHSINHAHIHAQISIGRGA